MASVEKKSVRTLFIEDSEDDRLLLTDVLESNGFLVQARQVTTAAGTRDALASETWDLILADFYLPGFDATQALRIYKESGLDIPFIVVSGSIGEDIATETMRNGAHDYLLKDHLARLPVAVERELREAENRRLRREAERERQMQSDELAQRAEQLYRSNKDLERFAYLAAHDLQEPLRTIRLYIGMLVKKYGRGDAETDAILDFIQGNAARMQGLIQGLLDYSRVTHHPDLRTKRVDANEELEHAIEQLRETVDETGAVITHDPLPHVTADPVQLCQVFSNLLSNAMKYRKSKETPRIHVSARQRSGETVFSVTDNGIGIDPAFHDQIFQIFRRLHRDEYPGVGVGLALAKRLIENHRGRVWVESEEGRGATFFFSIPAADR
jgi:signal transduction histidine kinase